MSALFAALDFPRVPRQVRGRAKRDALLAAALAQFGRQGYEATGVEELAQAAGVSVGTFYAYFRHKRQLLLALVADHFERIFACGLGELDLADPDPRAAIAAEVGQALDREGAAAGLRRAWREAVATDPELAAYDRAARARVCERLAAIIARGQAAGAVRREADPRATALAIMGLIIGLSDWPESGEAAVRAAAARLVAAALLGASERAALAGSDA